MNITIEISVEELKRLDSRVQRDVMMDSIGFAQRDIKSEIAERVVKAAVEQVGRHK